MDVFHFALSACFAAYILLLLEEGNEARPREIGLFSILLSILALIFLGISVLSIHTVLVPPLLWTTLGGALLAAGLGMGAWSFLRPRMIATWDIRLLALTAIATGASRWAPLAVFAALLMSGGQFLGLFVRHRARVFSREVRVRWLFPLVGALAIFILTALTAIAEQREKDAEMREDLLLQARLVANAISREDLDQLEFTLADETNLVYQRICRQMASFGRLMGHRSIYSQIFRDGKIIFGPESLDPKDPMASRPGTVYEHPPVLNYLLFLTAQPRTIGPYRDEYGTFVSAFVPVLNPATRKVQIVIGMDIETPTWRKVVGWARLRPLLFGFLGLVVVFLAQRALSLSVRRPGGAFWTRHAHAIALFLLGVLATVFLAQEAHRDEERSRHLTFWQLALSQSSRIQEAFQGVEEKELQSLVRFFESSEKITHEEFEKFTKDMHHLPYVRSWSFAPRVAPEKLDEHLRQVRTTVNPQYTVYRLPGAPHGDLYPQVLIEPLRPNVVMLGMDLASEPVIAEAIHNAERTGHSAISNAFQLLQENGSTVGAAIVHPVSLPSSSDSTLAPDGLVTAMIRFDLLLRGILDWTRPSGPERIQPFTVDLYQLDAMAAPVLLSTTRRQHESPLAGHLNGPDPCGAQVPLFLLGKTYLLTFTPSSLFSEIFPEKAGRVVLLLGLILTLVLTLFFAFILSWQRRLRSELELQSRGWRRSEKKFHTLVEKAPMAVVVLLDGVIQYANAAALHLLEGTQERRIQGINFCDFLNETSQTRFCQVIEDPESASATLEVVLEGSTGQIPCELSCVRIVVEGMRGYLLFIRNLTTQIQAQLENDRLQAQLAQARKMETISRLAGGVAHDFNNMLGVILGSADLLIEHLDAQDPNRRDVLEIQVAASRASDLMRRLLAFARRQDTSPVIMDLNQKMKGLIGPLTRQAGTGVTLRWEPAETLWLVNLDPAQLDQMLAILLSNAVEAMDGNGTVTLRTFNTVRSRPETGQTHEYVVLAISDTGTGMDGQVIAHLFEPFYSTKPSGEHSGLGLAMLHGIVNQNGGFIEVKSSPGEGATFELHLPKAFTAGRVSRSQDIPAARGVDESPPAPEPGMESILLVEDEEANLRIGQRILERAGYTVLPASGSSQALSLLEKIERPLQVMICDVALEGVTARELVLTVRARFPKIRVLFVSGYPEDMAVERGLIESGSHFLPKPFTGAQLLAAVRALHGQRPHRDDVINPK